MNTQIMKAALAGTMLVATSFGATTANAATTDAQARARILQQVTVNRTSHLEFGTVVTGAAASTVQVGTTGTRTCGAGLTCSGTAAAAAFGVTGTTGQLVNVNVGSTVTLSNGTNTMTASLVPSAATLTLAASNSFTVGGTLNVGANQADGNYAGTFNVTVDY